MITVLIDEMLPAKAAALAREEHGLQTYHVSELGLAHTDDAAIAQFARVRSWAVLTVLVFTLRRTLPPGGAMAAGLADRLARWVAANPEPFPGQHWLR